MRSWFVKVLAVVVIGVVGGVFAGSELDVAETHIRGPDRSGWGSSHGATSASTAAPAPASCERFGWTQAVRSSVDSASAGYYSGHDYGPHNGDIDHVVPWSLLKRHAPCTNSVYNDLDNLVSAAASVNRDVKGALSGRQWLAVWRVRYPAQYEANHCDFRNRYVRVANRYGVPHSVSLCSRHAETPAP